MIAALDSVDQSDTPPRRNPARRLALALGAGAVAVTSSIVSAQPAEAWAWDPTVQVVGSMSTCVPNGGGWIWYETSDGDRGWGIKWGGNGFTLPLKHVSTSGSVVTMKWGVANCSQVRHFIVHRPAFGTNASVGNLG